MKRWGLVFLFAWRLCNIGAQEMATLFVSMPDSLVPQLEDAWRKDLVELFRSGKPARLENRMEGTSSLLALTQDYLLLQSSARTVVEIKKLPLVNNTHVICLITTVQGPVADSRVEFYTTRWQPLNAAHLYTPALPEWFLTEGALLETDSCQNALSRLDMHLFHYRLHPDEPTLTATYTTPLYLNTAEREQVMPCLKNIPRVYTWKLSRFE